MDEDLIQLAIKNIKDLGKASIVRHYNGFIIMAQSELDFKAKISKISRGDTRGFYTVERAIHLND